MREIYDNDGASKDTESYSYARYLEERRKAEEGYFKDTPKNNVPEEHNLVNEDEKEHITDSLDCWCKPEVERVSNGNLVVVHNDIAKKVSDPIVQAVIDKFTARHLVGMKTYGVTMADNPAGTLEWIQHAQDELMDGILYLERLKTQIK